MAVCVCFGSKCLAAWIKYTVFESEMATSTKSSKPSKTAIEQFCTVTGKNYITCCIDMDCINCYCYFAAWTIWIYDFINKRVNELMMFGTWLFKYLFLSFPISFIVMLVFVVHFHRRLLINGLKPEALLNISKTLLIPQRKTNVFSTNINWLMLFREVLLFIQSYETHKYAVDSIQLLNVPVFVYTIFS